MREDTVAITADERAVANIDMKSGAAATTSSSAPACSSVSLTRPCRLSVCEITACCLSKWQDRLKPCRNDICRCGRRGYCASSGECLIHLFHWMRTGRQSLIVVDRLPVVIHAVFAHMADARKGNMRACLYRPPPAGTRRRVQRRPPSGRYRIRWRRRVHRIAGYRQAAPPKPWLSIARRF